MNKITTTIIFYVAGISFCLAQSYSYTYDASGNRTKREYSQYPQCKTGNTDDNDETTGNDKSKDDLTLNYGENLPSFSKNEKTEDENTLKQETAGNSNTISVAPNPSNGQFIMEGLERNAQYIITVYNVLGEIVYHLPLTTRHLPTVIDLSMQPKGMYMVKVLNGEEVYTGIVVVE